MHSKADLTLKLLLTSLHGGNLDQHLRYLPEGAAERLAAIHLTSANPDQLFPSPYEAIKHFHWSWFIRSVEEAPTGLRKLYLAALPTSQAKPLAEWMKTPLPKIPLGKAARRYLLHRLHKEASNQKVLPRPFLPQTPFGSLLVKSKRELVLIIDLLGLHDLAQELKHVVDKRALQRITSSLSPQRQNYLKHCLSTPDPFQTPKIGLAQWNGDPKLLKTKIHRRGLARLGRALAGQDPSFLWHIVHALDVGRGKTLRKYLSPKEVPGVTPVLSSQLSIIMRFLEK